MVRCLEINYDWLWKMKEKREFSESIRFGERHILLAFYLFDCSYTDFLASSCSLNNKLHMLQNNILVAFKLMERTEKKPTLK